MRVNKQVVSYVTQKVKELADVKRKPLTDELEAIAASNREAVSEYRSDVAELGRRCTSEIVKILKKHGLKLRHPERTNGKFWCLNGDVYYECELEPNDSDERSARIEAIRTELKRISSKVDMNVNEIIARLILGGTAGDLDQMLAAVRF